MLYWTIKLYPCINLTQVGMNRAKKVTQETQQHQPHIRGAEPKFVYYKMIFRVLTPRMWGYTDDSSDGVRCVSISPACVGIDRPSRI